MKRDAGPTVNILLAVLIGSLASGAAHAYELLARPTASCAGGSPIASGSTLTGTVYLDVEPQGMEAQGSQAQFYLTSATLEHRISNDNCGETSFGGAKPFDTTAFANGQYTITIWVWNAAQDATLWQADLAVVIDNQVAPAPPPALTCVSPPQLNWTAPTKNDDATPLTDLVGYRVRHGTVSGNWPDSVRVGLQTSYVWSNLPVGTHFFVAHAVAATGLESLPTLEVRCTVAQPPPPPPPLPPPPPPPVGVQLCMIDGSSTGTRSIFAKKLKADGAPTRGVSLGTIDVGPVSNDWAAPFDRIECRCDSSFVYGVARYAELVSQAGAFVAGCRAFGRH